MNSLKANGLFTVKSLARGNDVGQRYIIDFIHQRNTQYIFCTVKSALESELVRDLDQSLDQQYISSEKW